MSLRYGVGSAPNSTRCGATCAAKPIHAGYGTPLITTQARCEPMCVDDGRTRSFWSSKRCWSLLASRAISPTGGVPTSGISLLRSIKWGRQTPRKSRANTLICGPVLSGESVGRCASRRRNACTISCWGCSSIVTNSDDLFNLESTPLRQLRPQYDLDALMQSLHSSGIPSYHNLSGAHARSLRDASGFPAPP